MNERTALPPRPHPRATVFRTSRAFVVQPDGRTSAGVTIGVDPIEVVASQQELPAALERAFEASKTRVVPHPHDWASYEPPLQRVEEYLRGRKRVFGVRGCAVDADAELFRVTPMKPLDRYNWGFDDESTLTVPYGHDLTPLANAIASVLAAAARL
jgi:hypothetical protein